MSGLLDRSLEEVQAEYDDVCSEIAFLEEENNPEDLDRLDELRDLEADLEGEIAYLEGEFL